MTLTHFCVFLNRDANMRSSNYIDYDAYITAALSGTVFQTLYRLEKEYSYQHYRLNPVLSSIKQAYGTIYGHSVMCRRGGDALTVLRIVLFVVHPALS